MVVKSLWNETCDVRPELPGACPEAQADCLEARGACPNVPDACPKPLKLVPCQT